MIQWLTQKHVFPRWALLVSVILMSTSFGLLYCRVLDFDRAVQSLAVKLWFAQNVGSIDYYPIPTTGPLQYPDVMIALLCTLTVTSVVIWRLCVKQPKRLSEQEAAYTTLLQTLGQASFEEVRAVLDEREAVYPERALNAEVIQKLRERIEKEHK